MSTRVSALVNVDHHNRCALFMCEYDVLASAHRGGLDPVELGDGVAVLVFAPGGFELTGGGTLQGFTPQVAKKVLPVSVAGSKRAEKCAVSAESVGDETCSVPCAADMGECGVWSVPRRLFSGSLGSRPCRTTNPV